MKGKDLYILGSKLFGVYCLVLAVPRIHALASFPPYYYLKKYGILGATGISLCLLWPWVYILAGSFLIIRGEVICKFFCAEDINSLDTAEDIFRFSRQILGIFLVVNFFPDFLQRLQTLVFTSNIPNSPLWATEPWRLRLDVILALWNTLAGIYLAVFGRCVDKLVFFRFRARGILPVESGKEYGQPPIRGPFMLGVTGMLIISAGMYVMLRRAPVTQTKVDTPVIKTKHPYTGHITIPVGNMAGGVEPIANARIAVTSIPEWITISSASSYLGPMAIYPGEEVTFTVDFEREYDMPKSSGEIVINFYSDSPSFVPNSLTWRFKSDNGFLTMHGACVDGDGIWCGEYESPDIFAPQTQLEYEIPEYSDEHGRIFISTFTRIYVNSFDRYESNSMISRVAFTGYAINSPAPVFEALNVYVEPFLLAEGKHTLYFASRDNAGNTEIVKSTDIYVDGSAPVTNIRVYGPKDIDAQGNMIVSVNHYIDFIKYDPRGNGVASGIKHVLYSVDNGAFSVFQSTFALTEGLHRISYYSVDCVDNAEFPHTLQAFFLKE